MKKIIISIFLTLIVNYVQAQKETNLWYFGNNVGLDFNNLITVTATDGTLVTDIPTMVNGPIKTIEGCFTLSDKDGNLLMSSDGRTVYNKNNLVMDNGTGLKGDASASQSGIVIPVPNDDMKYYIISVDRYDSSIGAGINYSIVDLSLSGGLGAVTTKNVNILSGQRSENIMVVPNASNDGYWLLHRDKTTFYVWKVTASGFTLSSTFGFVAPIGSSNHMVGYLTASSDYSKIAAVALNSYSLVADFDNSTGTISNIKVRNDIKDVYKIEFSPSGEWLIIACSWSGIALYSIKYSDFLSGGAVSTIYNQKISCVQKHTDGRMYGTGYNSDKALFVIMDPDAGGTIVKKIANFFPSDPQWGLPTFATGYLRLKSIVSSFACTDYNTRLEIEISFAGNPPASLEWDFGDGSAKVTQPVVGGVTKYSQKHSYSTSGIKSFTVTPYAADGTALQKITDKINVIDCPIRSNRMIRIDQQNIK